MMLMMLIRCLRCLPKGAKMTDPLYVMVNKEKARVIDDMKWISVKDEWPNPDKQERILCYNGDYVFDCEWDEDCWCNIGGEEFTHWMPLPDLPATGT